MSKVPGHGLDLARRIYGGYAPLTSQLVPPQELPVVGTTPPQWDSFVSGYTDVDILNLIIFYNEDFGIEPGDDLSACKDKFRAWLYAY
jgi:hypothetical protein